MVFFQIRYLSDKKPTNMSIVQFLPMVFTDEALDGYNFNGTNTSGKCKLPMRGYKIFSHCFVGWYTIALTHEGMMKRKSSFSSDKFRRICIRRTGHQRAGHPNDSSYQAEPQSNAPTNVSSEKIHPEAVG